MGGKVAHLCPFLKLCNILDAQAVINSQKSSEQLSIWQHQDYSLRINAKIYSLHLAMKVELD